MDYYLADEKKIIHQDGWQYVVRDSEDGLIQIGYQEIRDGKLVYVGEIMEVPSSVAKPIAEAIMFFANKLESR